MIIDCIADLHGRYPQLEGGDLLIVAGDLTARHTENEFALFDYWLKEQNYKTKIVIAGNHDGFLEDFGLDYMNTGKSYLAFGEYLCDSGTEFEYQESSIGEISDQEHLIKTHKLKIWGSPWSLTFDRINPKCAAFTGNEADLKAKFDLIPDDIDILVTHSPPHGCYLDEKRDGTMLGSVALRDRCWDLKLQLHVFGHIHEGYGRHGNNVNASHVNEHYQPVNKPIRVIL